MYDNYNIYPRACSTLVSELATFLSFEQITNISISLLILLLLLLILKIGLIFFGDSSSFPPFESIAKNFVKKISAVALTNSTEMRSRNNDFIVFQNNAENFVIPMKVGIFVS